jgi:hypothetical protein
MSCAGAANLEGKAGLLGNNMASRPCLSCGVRETRARAGICWHCKKAPAVQVDPV